MILDILIRLCRFLVTDHVFDQECSNSTVYEHLTKDVINAAVEGFNGGTLFPNILSLVCCFILFS